MPSGSFRLEFTTKAASQKAALEHGDPKKHKRVLKALGWLELNPAHPGLHSHPYDSLRGDQGEVAWESYVENQTPAAFRIIWCYKKGIRGVIAVIAIIPHP